MSYGLPSSFDRWLTTDPRDSSRYPECPDCEGTGYRIAVNEDNEAVLMDDDCPRCGGDGRIDPRAEADEDREVEWDDYGGQNPEPF